MREPAGIGARREVRLVEGRDRWELHDSHLEVWSVTIDSCVRFQLSEDAVVTVEGEARVSRGASEERMDVEPAGVLAALSLLWKTVDSVTAFKDGRLEMRFGDGAVLEVAAGERYESWQIEAWNGVRVVSLPGGELAVWLSGESVSIDGRSRSVTGRMPEAGHGRTEP